MPRRAVPATTVVGRRVTPFRFGRPTGSGERWLRTCPAEPVPGRFPTQRGWRDAFALLAGEDPAGSVIVAVLAQEGVPARWSGAALPAADGGLLVDGVAGFGDGFMLARAAPGPAPGPGGGRRPPDGRAGRRHPRPGPLRVGP